MKHGIDYFTPEEQWITTKYIYLYLNLRPIYVLFHFNNKILVIICGYVYIMYTLLINTLPQQYYIITAVYRC